MAMRGTRNERYYPFRGEGNINNFSCVVKTSGKKKLLFCVIDNYKCVMKSK